jgi:hypothetical protein
VERIFQVREERPEKNTLNLLTDLTEGRRPRGCPVSLGRARHWSEVPRPGTEPPPAAQSPEDKLLSALRGIPGPLEQNNNFLPALGTGVGVPSVASAFGVVPDPSPHNPGGVVENLPLEFFDDFEPPDVNTAGCWPEVRETIEYYQAHTPSEIKICYPDMQGPLNTAHTILGTPVFLAMRLEPERLHYLLQMITDFNIQAHRALGEWIEPERQVPSVAYTSRICECSVDLISREAYHEFCLPYDRQIAAALGKIAIHMDGGRHVFEETLWNLPQIRYTEWCETRAGFAPQISQDEALAEIGDRPIVLSGGTELWDGDFEGRILDQLSRMEDHPLQSFGFTVMTGRQEDEPDLVAMRGRLDEWYAERFG